MGDIGKVLLAVAAVVMLGALLKKEFIDRQTDVALQEVGKTLDQVRKEGMEKRPDLAPSEAIRREAVAQTTQQLAAESDRDKRLATAASNFLGFYLINTRERVAFCNERGVSIGPFAAAFERGHAAELAKARAIMANAPLSEDKLYEMLQPQLRQMIAQDMKDIAEGNKVSVQAACQLIATNGEPLAAEMHISKMQPAVYQVLVEGR